MKKKSGYRRTEREITVCALLHFHISSKLKHLIYTYMHIPVCELPVFCSLMQINPYNRLRHLKFLHIFSRSKMLFSTKLINVREGDSKTSTIESLCGSVLQQYK